MKTILTLLLCNLSLSVASWACLCFGNDSFCGSMTWEYKPDILIIGKKISAIDHGMEVEIMTVYKGDVQEKDTLMVWGDNGLQCRIPTAAFEIGEEIILGLHQLEYPWPGVEQEKAGDYELSICGIYYYSLSKGHPYAPETFEEIQACIQSITDVSTPVKNEGLELFPNPTSGEFSIVMNEYWHTQNVQVELYNTLGQIVQVQNFAPSAQIQVEAAHLPVGVYYVRMRQAAKVENEAVWKIVKN